MSLFGNLTVGTETAYRSDVGGLYGSYVPDSTGDREFRFADIANGNDDGTKIYASSIAFGRGGDDTIVFSNGNNLVSGGAGADTFRFQNERFEDIPGTNDALGLGGLNVRGGQDVITDFDFRQGDKLSFEPGIKIVGASFQETGINEVFGISTNNGSKQLDVVLTVVDEGGRQQDIVLIDAGYSGNAKAQAQWASYLKELGYDGALLIA